MRKIAGMILLVVACAGLVFAQDKMAPAKAPSTADAVKQLERDWIAAEKAGDADRLSQILADDWVALGPDGSTIAKQAFIADYKSGKSKVESFEIGPMTVKVMGNVAVVQGSDTEKSVSGGKDSSGKYVWMDVFEKRDGKWQAVRSQNAMVK
ncbi:MAG: nuclear transport factor 2 family protein [Candidatus Acidiferrales bacterium]